MPDRPALDRWLAEADEMLVTQVDSDAMRCRPVTENDRDEMTAPVQAGLTVTAEGRVFGYLHVFPRLLRLID